MSADFYPPLTPRMPPWMHKVIRNRDILFELINKYKSPVNMHYTGPFKQNYEAFRSVMNKHGLAHTVYFARKANKCRAFVREAKQAGFGVDTASYRELKQCLELGCPPSRLVVTAAVKNEQLLRLALRHDVLIILDNEDECRIVNTLAGELDKRPKVGLRISGFTFEREKLYSRFGIDVDDVIPFVKRLDSEAPFDCLQFDGFHFHLDGYSIGQRAAALLQTIALSDELRRHGISTSFIDAGGGFLVRYLADKNEWLTFLKELKRAVRGERKPITFTNDGLGYELRDGKVRGKPAVYPFYNETPKTQFLDAVLTHKNKGGQAIASLLNERDIEFRIEPGRSLLDQTGMTIARVIYRKKDQRRNWLAGLQMNRSQLNSSSADFLVDPVYIEQRPKSKCEPTPVYFTGASCVEGDLLLKRAILLPQLPEPGDLVVFPNTAGYLMHFYETEAHLFDLATNLVTDTISSFHFVRDSDYER